MSKENRLPFVSVIIPVYNEPDNIRNSLSSIVDQTYPETRYEVLVVDNGSTDETRTAVREFPVQLLVEDEVQGSYAARNKGIKRASGDILAFVDADCVPEREWIWNGVSKMYDANADLISGRIRFNLSSKKTASERFDAMVHMRNDKKVQRGVAMTANLFVRKKVFEEIGKFPRYLPSGGDIYWTRTATNSGMKLVYSPEAIVDHPSRQLRPLLKKMYRVGNGNVEMWYLDDKTTSWTVIGGLLQFPLKVFRFVKREIEDETEQNMQTPPDRDIEQTVDVYLAAVLAVIALLIGRIAGLVKLFSRLLIR